MAEWSALLFDKSVVKRACYSALIVGAVLIAINYGDDVLHGQLDGTRIFKMCLTVVVPYVVSTVSSVITMRDMKI
jgi:hypothetical protein